MINNFRSEMLTKIKEKEHQQGNMEGEEKMTTEKREGSMSKVMEVVTKEGKGRVSFEHIHLNIEHLAKCNI